MTFIAVAALLSLAGTPPAEPRRISVSLPQLGLVGEFDRARADSYLDFFAERLSRTGTWDVTTSNQVAQLLGVERQKQLLGCTEDSSCLVEVAAALGGETLISGNLGKIGTAYTINLRLISATTGKTIAAASDRVPSDDALYGWLERTASLFTEKARAELRPGLRALTPTAAKPNPGPGLIVAGLGLAGIAVASGLWVASGADALRLRTEMPPFADDAEFLAVSRRGLAMQTGGWIAAIGGAAALVTGALLAFLLRIPPQDQEPSVALLSAFPLPSLWRTQ